MTSKLKQSEVKHVREAMLRSQGNKCDICKYPLEPENARLDHDHGSGLVRSVLCNGCNALEGVVKRGASRYAVKDIDAFLAGLLEYRKHHATDRTGLIYPSHKTAQEKKEAAARKRKAKAKKDKK